jgi:transcriptional regulator with XRE-family HTH domain
MGARPQHSSRYRRLCGLLRGWRTSAGLTQRDLAAKLKKPPSFVHKTEVADRRIDPLELIAWCLACGVDPAKGIAEIRRQT